jgi:hypothetical protein
MIIKTLISHSGESRNPDLYYLLAGSIVVDDDLQLTRTSLFHQELSSPFPSLLPLSLRMLLSLEGEAG